MAILSDMERKDPEYRYEMTRGIAIILGFGLALAAFLFAAYSSYYAYERLAVHQAERLERAAVLFGERIETGAQDARILADAVGTHLLTQSPVQEIETVFAATLAERLGYDHVRFIDAQGQERLRLNSGEGRPTRVPQHLLQNKRHRPYVRDTLLLTEGVRISRINWNQEYGILEIPRRPMVRFTAPVIVQGRVRGLVALNYEIKHFRDELQKIGLEFGGAAHLLNEQGEVLAHDPGREGFGPVPQALPVPLQAYQAALAVDSSTPQAISRWVSGDGIRVCVALVPIHLEGRSTRHAVQRWYVAYRPRPLAFITRQQVLLLYPRQPFPCSTPPSSSYC